MCGNCLEAFDFHCKTEFLVIDRNRLDTNMRDKFLPRELSVVSEAKHVNIIRMHYVLHCKMASIDKVLIVTGRASNFCQ